MTGFTVQRQDQYRARIGRAARAAHTHGVKPPVKGAGVDRHTD